MTCSLWLVPPEKLLSALLNPCNYLFPFPRRESWRTSLQELLRSWWWDSGAGREAPGGDRDRVGSWWELLQGRSTGLGGGSPGARSGSALCDLGQVHPLGCLLLCDRRGLGRCPPKSLPSFCPQRGLSCVYVRPLLCLLIPCILFLCHDRDWQQWACSGYLQRGDPQPLLWSLISPAWNEGCSSSCIPFGIQYGPLFSLPLLLRGTFRSPPEGHHCSQSMETLFANHVLKV